MSKLLYQQQLARQRAEQRGDGAAPPPRDSSDRPLTSGGGKSSIDDAELAERMRMLEEVKRERQAERDRAAGRREPVVPPPAPLGLVRSDSRGSTSSVKTDIQVISLMD